MSDALAKARAAVLAGLVRDEITLPARWRTVITDSESPTGVAPVCTGERSDTMHMIDDYPGGPTRDEDGVYDCCPYPQFDTYSTDVATYLVELLNADAETSDSFFQPGRIYTREHHGQPIEFRVTAVTSSPDGVQRMAHGWRTDPYSDWEVFNSGDVAGWTDVTEVTG